MDAIEPAAKKLHPLVATAAAAVIVVSVLGAIVLITDKVAAHKGADAPAPVAATDTAAAPPPAVPAQAATADTTGTSEKPIAPLPGPPHKTTHTPKPKASAPIAEASPPPPPAAAPPPL